MTEFKGTSKPWVVHNEYYCPEEIWGDLDGPLEDGRIRGEKVCEVNMDHPRGIANRSLISAAPDLLEAVETFLADLRTPGSPLTKAGRADRIAMAESVIAKALGETQ